MKTVNVHYLDRWQTVSPLRIYTQPNLFNELVEALGKALLKLDMDTVAACSLAAIPLAVALGGWLNAHDKNIRKLIFLGNGTRAYFENLFQSSNNILLCDDMVGCGGLAYRVFREFIAPDKSLTGIATIVDQDNSPHRKYLHHLPPNATYLTILKARELETSDTR